MNQQFLTNNWALVIAGILLAGIAIFVLIRVVQASAGGQLRARLGGLRARYRELVKAQKRLDAGERRHEKLLARAARVKPRQLQEASEAVADARALLKIAQDQVLIAENHVRKVILEEFPPRRHDRLRAKYLKRPEVDGKPFTF